MSTRNYSAPLNSKQNAREGFHGIHFYLFLEAWRAKCPVEVFSNSSEEVLNSYEYKGKSCFAFVSILKPEKSDATCCGSGIDCFFPSRMKIYFYQQYI